MQISVVEGVTALSSQFQQTLVLFTQRFCNSAAKTSRLCTAFVLSHCVKQRWRKVCHFVHHATYAELKMAWRYTS